MNDKLVPVYSSSFKKSSPFSESPLRGCDSFQPSALSFTTIGDTNLHNSNDSFKKTYVSPELSVAPRPANDTFSTSHSRPQLQLRPLTDNFTTVKSHFTSGLDPAFTQPNIPSSLSSPTSKSDVEASCRSLLLTFLMRQVAISPGETSRQKAVVAEALAYLGQAELLRTDWDSWQPPRFPVTGLNLTQTWNIKPGRQMGRVLAALRLRWADSDFQLTRDELLSEKFRLSLIEEDILVEANETCTKAKRKK
ncbi:unnamed protein product [Protopolystoma xenopodis]|uniref:Uncharacterized protein n=1 Tax=Protopolystoma xenopodis TaxID=117903 RepID=A0A448WSI6_9PLAT|nr:unnamed protein product [Protopolystoma xenopodis]